MTLENAYRYCRDSLRNKNIDEADFKALCIICHVAGIENSEFHLKSQNEISTDAAVPLIKRLENGEPLQYVIGKWDFYESEFYVGKGVLIPRPETEELVDLAVKECRNYKKPLVFDLCAGSGCIGISIAKKINDSIVYCIEKSKDAVYYLNKNAFGVDNVNIINSDINDDITLPEADIIISNPPYIKESELSHLQKELSFEPEMALNGGEDGLDFYRVINEKWSSRLNENGVLLLEIGNEQGEAVKSVLTNFKNIEVIKDMYGNNRIVKCNKR